MKPRFTLFERLVLMCLCSMWGSKQHVYDWEQGAINTIRSLIGLNPDVGDCIEEWIREDLKRFKDNL